MVRADVFRPPSQSECQIFARLLEDPFAGRDELRDQLRDCVVRPLDESGSLEIQTKSTAAASVRKTVPIEAEAEDMDGMTIRYLLHVVDGRAVELEIYKDDGSSIRGAPPPRELRVVHLPP